MVNLAFVAIAAVIRLCFEVEDEQRVTRLHALLQHRLSAVFGCLFDVFLRRLDGRMLIDVLMQRKTMRVELARRVTYVAARGSKLIYDFFRRCRNCCHFSSVTLSRARASCP